MWIGCILRTLNDDEFAAHLWEPVGFSRNVRPTWISKTRVVRTVGSVLGSNNGVTAERPTSTRKLF